MPLCPLSLFLPTLPAPTDSVPVPAGCVDGAISTDGSQCYGFEHDAHEYCSNESITTWIWTRGPAPAWSSSVLTAASVTAECASGAMKLNAARARVVPADVAPVAAALSGAKKLHAARGRVDPVSPVPAAAKCALPGAKTARRGRDISVPTAPVTDSLPAAVAPVAVDFALPRAKKSLAARGRPVPVATLVPVAAAECALPGAKKLAARGRVSAPDVPVDVPDVPAAYAPVAPDAADVPVPVVLGAHESCATRNCKVSQLKITPRSDRKHNCANCASMGFCSQSSRCSGGGGGGGGGCCNKKHCKTQSSRSKSLWGVPGTNGRSKDKPPVQLHFQ